jgi:hypothetical protein
MNSRLESISIFKGPIPLKRMSTVCDMRWFAKNNATPMLESGVNYWGKILWYMEVRDDQIIEIRGMTA